MWMCFIVAPSVSAASVIEGGRSSVLLSHFLFIDENFKYIQVVGSDFEEVQYIEQYEKEVWSCVNLGVSILHSHIHILVYS
jgi:hypothetical protein